MPDQSHEYPSFSPVSSPPPNDPDREPPQQPVADADNSASIAPALSLRRRRDSALLFPSMNGRAPPSRGLCATSIRSMGPQCGVPADMFQAILDVTPCNPLQLSPALKQLQRCEGQRGIDNLMCPRQPRTRARLRSSCLASSPGCNRSVPLTPWASQHPCS